MLNQDARDIIDSELYRLTGAVEEVCAPLEGTARAVALESAIGYIVRQLYIEWLGEAQRPAQAMTLAEIGAAEYIPDVKCRLHEHCTEKDHDVDCENT